MLTAISEFRFGEGYRVIVKFSDGAEGVHDLSTVVARNGAAIEPLKKIDYFRRGFLEFGALTWPNGFDIAPEWLRREMDAAGELHFVNAAE